jgi:pSer/pThr/pTyr-binding forkhead associated (FHA) protein
LGTTTTESRPMPPVEEVPGIAVGHHVLLIDRGPSAGTQVELVGPQMTAGRSPENAIFLDDITVSRQHVSFVQTEGRWRLQDLGSLNGTYVNGERIDEAELTHGDQIQLGKYRFHYLSGAAGPGHP